MGCERFSSSLPTFLEALTNCQLLEQIVVTHGNMESKQRRAEESTRSHPSMKLSTRLSECVDHKHKMSSWLIRNCWSGCVDLGIDA